MGRKNLVELIGGSQVIAAPTTIAHRDKNTMGKIISMSSLIDISAGLAVGPQTVTNLSRIEYNEVNPTLIIDSRVSGRLFCMFIADSIIISFE